MVFNLTVSFTGIYRKMFKEDSLYIRVTLVNGIYRLYVMQKNSDGETEFTDYFEFLKNIKKYNITKKHIEKLKRNNITNFRGEELLLEADDFDIPLNPLREVDFFIRNNITGRRTEFLEFIENTVDTMYVTTDYIDYKFTDVNTSYAKIYSAKIRQENDSFECDVKCFAKLKDVNGKYFYSTFEIRDYINSQNLIYPSEEFLKIPELYGKYVEILPEYLENLDYIAYNDISLFTREFFINGLEQCRVIVDPLRNTLLPCRILLDVCYENCPSKDIKSGSLIYETCLTNVKNSILSTYNVYVKRHYIMDIFKIINSR